LDFQLDQFLGEQVVVTHCVGTGELFLMMEEAKKNVSAPVINCWWLIPTNWHQKKSFRFKWTIMMIMKNF
jgi:hypothetical protein